MELKVVNPDVDTADATVVIGVLAGLEPVPGSEEIFESLDGNQLEVAGFEGKSGQSLVLPGAAAKAILVMGLGDEVSFDSIRGASGEAVRRVKTRRLVSRLGMVDLDQASRAVVEGSLLGGYQYRTYKSEGEGISVEIVEIVSGDEGQVGEASILAAATNRARDLVNTPANDLSPVDLAMAIAQAASEAGIEVVIWDLERIRTEKLGALLGVAAGSDREPRVVTLTYRPEGAKAHLGLVGKGITFDSGGLSIKPSASMEEMKADMSGAAIVASATAAIALLGLPVAVTCVTPLTDNAVGGNATRPGDVLKPVAGPTIEVLNTDAEGRLVLADGLGLVRRHGPDLIVDVATLTGAAHVALGDKIAAVFGSDADVSQKVLDAASRAGESFWELPLYRDYRKLLDSNVADIKNISGTRYGGAIVAAVFLAEYAGEVPWAHLDIAGPAMSKETLGDQVKGASGVGVRTLIELARALSEQE